MSRAEPISLLRSSARDRAALIACAAVAIVCMAAAFASHQWWIGFFAHPQVDSAITAKGVTLWRAMLGVLAVAIMVGWACIWRFRAAGTPKAAQATRQAGRVRVYGVMGLVVVAFLIRATRINESLWYDEIASWRTYNGGVRGFGAVIGAFLDPINHTLHTLLNRWSVEFLFPTLSLEVAFRLPALSFSLLTVPVMFGLGRTAVSERVGWIAATLAAIAPVCVLEGLEARGYAQMIFFSAAATWTFILAFRRSSTSMWLVYALCCGLGVWSQFLTAWVAIGHGGWLAWRWIVAPDDRRRCGQGFVALMLGGLVSITLYAPLIPGLLAWRENFDAANPNQPRIFGPEGWHALLQLGGAWYAWAALAGLLMFGVGCWAALRRERSDGTRTISPGDALLLSLIGLPLMLLAVAIGGTWLYARFLLFGAPGALLAMSIGIDLLWTRKQLFGIVALAIMTVASLADLYVRPPKQPLREAVDFVRDHQHAGDRVLAVGLAHDVLSVYGVDMDIANSLLLGRDLAEKLKSIQPQWVIVEYPLHVPQHRFDLLRESGYAEVARLRGWADWKHGDVLVFARQPSGD